MMTEESLEELNRNLPAGTEEKASFLNFRPSIIIKGTPEPFAEDMWTFVRIGNGRGPIFKQSKPCTRCKLTTVSPLKGEFREDGEPLSTLLRLKSSRSFGDETTNRLVQNQAVLGVQMGLFHEGEPIKQGDPVYAAIL